MEFEQVIKLIEAVSQSELSQFTYEGDGVKLDFKKDRGGVVVPLEMGNPMMQAQPLASTPIMQAPQAQPLASTPIMQAPQAQPLTSTLMQTPDAAPVKPAEEATGHVVASPLVGTFYASPSPEEEPFVKVGDQVKKGQVLGIVEAMKLMNEIESEYEGVVTEVLVENESVVEFGQPMFVIA